MRLAADSTAISTTAPNSACSWSAWPSPTPQTARPLTGPLRAATSRVAVALTDLRRIGRGDAAIIAELGLDDAVTAIAGTSEIPMSVAFESLCLARARLLAAGRGDDRLSTRPRLASRRPTLQHQGIGGPTAMPRTGQREGGIRREYDGDVFTERSADHDRVLASGGRIAVEDDGHVFEVWLP